MGDADISDIASEIDFMAADAMRAARAAHYFRRYLI